MTDKTTMTRPVAAAIGIALASSLAVSSVALAADNPFGMTDLHSGYLLAGGDNKGEEGKCGEGKCGDKGEKGAEGNCGEKGKEGSCGEKGKEGSCGEKGKEGSCGEKTGDDGDDGDNG